MTTKTIVIFLLHLIVFHSARAASDQSHFWTKDFSGLRIGSKNLKALLKKEEDSCKKIRDALGVLGVGKYKGAINVPTINLATVAILYRVRSTVQYYSFNKIFTSRWAPQGNEKTKIESIFGLGSLKSLGSYYNLTTQDLEQNTLGKSGELKKLSDDFENRGLDIASSLTNGTFSHQSYDHSEQAFLSCVSRGDCQIPTVVPDSVVIVISSRNPACQVCESALKKITKDVALKIKFLKNIFPGLPKKVNGIKLNIVYVSANIPPTAGVDFSTKTAHFIDSRQ